MSMFAMNVLNGMEYNVLIEKMDGIHNTDCNDKVIQIIYMVIIAVFIDCDDILII